MMPSLGDSVWPAPPRSPVPPSPPGPINPLEEGGPGLTLFALLSVAGFLSPTFYRTLTLAASSFPLLLEIQSFLGITPEHPEPDPSVYAPDLLVMAALVLLAQVESYFWAINAAGRLIAVPPQVIRSVETQPDPAVTSAP